MGDGAAWLLATLDADRSIAVDVNHRTNSPPLRRITNGIGQKFEFDRTLRWRISHEPGDFRKDSRWRIGVGAVLELHTKRGSIEGDSVVAEYDMSRDDHEL